MSEWLVVAGLTLMAGMAMPAGALVATVERIRPNWLENRFRHAVLAFGGGALLSAVALVLVPEGSETLSPWHSVAAFTMGGIAFYYLDILLAQSRSPSSQLAAMLSDFIPEAMALGAAFSATSNSAFLLAILIALQNVPEGFNAYREIKEGSNLRGSIIVGIFALLALLGPLAGLGGYFVLSGFENTVAFIKLFAGGGILYLVFQDVAPEAKLPGAWSPSLGAVLGFGLGLLGHCLLPTG